jgi:hypothetical protein
LDSTFYLYRSVSDAQAGNESGGTGFLVGIPSVHEGRIHLYAVTNRHLIDAQFCVLRVNTTAGGMEPIQSKWGDWHPHPDGDDVSIMPVTDIDTAVRWHYIDEREFITEDLISQLDIGPGDEVFLVGRLITAAGTQRNKPVVRFGNISMLADPSEPIKHEKYGSQVSFLVECRSLSGFSGSPVFVTSSQPLLLDEIARRFLGDRYQESPGMPRVRLPGRVIGPTIAGLNGPWFLGIDWGHVPLWRSVHEQDKRTPVADGHAVEMNTGIACVIPAWRILELLNNEEFVKQRKADDTRFTESLAASGSTDTTAVLDSNPSKRP